MLLLEMFSFLLLSDVTFYSIGYRYKKVVQSEKRILVAAFVLVGERLHKCAKLRVPAMQLIINNDSDVICRGCQIGVCCLES